jgi:hypothetical protein
MPGHDTLSSEVCSSELEAVVRLQVSGNAGVGLAVALRIGVAVAFLAPDEAQPEATVARSSARVAESIDRSGDDWRAGCASGGRSSFPSALGTDLTVVPMLNTAGRLCTSPNLRAAAYCTCRRGI